MGDKRVQGISYGKPPMFEQRSSQLYVMPLYSICYIMQRVSIYIQYEWMKLGIQKKAR